MSVGRTRQTAAGDTRQTVADTRRTTVGATRCRPENTVLTESQGERVRAYLDRRGARCPACGGTGFTVGAALYLGFLFLHEEQDAYLVALTCTNPQCSVPHTGIRVRRAQLWPESGVDTTEEPGATGG